jgi:hypothetical protein
MSTTTTSSAAETTPAATTTAAATTTPAATTVTTETTTATIAPDFAAGGIILIIFLILFAILGLYSIIKSLMCFGKSGSTAEKVIGVLIAFFTGPFYLLYLNFNTGYCEDESPMFNSPMPSPMPPAMPPSQQMGGRRRK